MTNKKSRKDCSNLLSQWGFFLLNINFYPAYTITNLSCQHTIKNFTKPLFTRFFADTTIIFEEIYKKGIDNQERSFYNHNNNLI